MENTKYSDVPAVLFAKDLLTYVFEQAAIGGKARNWNYIDGVMRKLAQRGIDTIEKAEEYDYERNGGHG